MVQLFLPHSTEYVTWYRKSIFNTWASFWYSWILAKKGKRSKRGKRRGLECANCVIIEEFMLSALLPLIFLGVPSNFYHVLGYFLVRIAWNPKVNFTHSAISGDLFTQITWNLWIAWALQKNQNSSSLMKYFQFILTNKNRHIYQTCIRHLFMLFGEKKIVNSRWNSRCWLSIWYGSL